MPEITPSVYANAIMGKIYNVLTNGDETVPKSSDNFFCWATPGIPVDKKDFEFLKQGLTGVVKPESVKTLREAAGAAAASGADGAEVVRLSEAELEKLRAEDTAGLYMQAESLARMVDFVPDVTSLNNKNNTNLSIMNDEGTLSEIYKRVLQFSQVKQSELTDKEKKKLKRLRSLLVETTLKTDLITDEKVEVTGPSKMVVAYNDKMAAYMNEALEYNNRRIDALAADNAKAVHYWAINAGILRNKVKAAMNDWVSSGYKNEFDQIAAYIDQVEGRDLTLLKQEYKDDLEKAKLTSMVSGSDFYYTSLVPANFATATSWSHFYFTQSDFSRYADSKFNASGWEAKGGASYLGLVNVGGGGGGSSRHNEYNGTFDSSSCSMSFEIAQVNIVRAWFKSSFLSSKAWRFDVNNPDFEKNDMLCDGSKPPKGLLAAYPTSVILIRNLSLNFGKNSGFAKFVADSNSSHAGGGGSVAFGPFLLGGGGSHSSSSGSTSSEGDNTYTNEGMSVPGMQIVGYKCHIMPKSPDPSPSIKEWV